MARPSVDARGLIPVQALTAIREALDLCNRIVGIVITSDAEYHAAGQLLIEARRRRRDLEGEKRAARMPWAEKTNLVDVQFGAVLQVLENVDRRLAQGLGAWYGKLKGKGERLELRGLDHADERRERLLQKATKSPEKALALQENAEYTIAATEDPDRPEGLYFGLRYRARLKDLDGAVHACMGRQELRKYVLIDLKGLAGLQWDARGELKVEGIAFTEEHSPRVGPKGVDHAPD